MIINARESPSTTPYDRPDEQAAADQMQRIFPMKKMDRAAVAVHTGSHYPYPFNLPCNGQSCQRLARDAGLTLFGVNLTVIEPGAWSSQRHWHSHEDEFIWVVEGELTLVTDTGEELLRAGDCAAFRRGVDDGHHLINKSARPARVLEIGNSDAQDRCVYSDIDMVAGPGNEGYRHRDGTPYPRGSG
jgi:uncharacterized cupin superfamily protein